MSLINKKFFLVLAASCAAFSVTGCTEEKVEPNIRLSNLYSEKAAYAQDEEIILNVTASTKTSDYILKSVTVKYYLDYTRQTTNTFSVQPLDEVSTITNYVIATNTIKKNEQSAQKFEITKFTYSFDSQIYEEESNVSYTVSKKSSSSLSESYVKIDDINFKSSLTNFAPDFVSDDGLEKHYSLKRSVLASPTSILQIELPCTYDEDEVKDLFWMVRATLEDGSVGEFTVARNNLNLVEDSEWIVSATRKIEVYGTMFRLSNEVQTRTSMFEVVPTVNIEAISSGIRVANAQIRTETALSTQVSGIYYANKTDRIQLTIDVYCGNEHEITGIYFTYEKGGTENRIPASLKGITYAPVPGGNGLICASVSVNINFGSSGTYNFKKFEATFKYKDSSSDEVLEADTLTKELKLNVLDGLIQNAAEFVSSIQENPSGYFALVSSFELSGSYVTDYITENFSGTVDGNGYRISISYGRSCWFKTNNGTIKNLTIYAPSLRITQDIKTTCIFAETNAGTITDVTIDGIEFYIDQDGAGFKGITTVNNGTLSNIELLYNSAEYKSSANWSTSFTGLCETNNGRIVGVIASYADGFKWKDDLPTSYNAVRRWAKTLNCIVKTNNATGQFSNGVDKGMMDIILYYQFDPVKNSFHKVNLFYADGNGNKARLFYWKEGIHSALSTSVLDIVHFDDKGFNNNKTVSTVSEAVGKLVAGNFFNESSGLYYGIHFDRPYVFGFDNGALYANESWKDSSGVIHSRKASHFVHLMYAECFRNVGYTETNQYVIEDNPGVYTNGGTLMVFNGTINSGNYVAYNELYTNEFLFGKSKGTFLSTQSWNSNLRLIHTKSFVVFYN